MGGTLATQPLLRCRGLTGLSGSPRPGVDTHLEEDVHVLPGGVLLDHRVRVLAHHVVDGLDDVHHLLHGDREAQGGDREVTLFSGDGLGLLIPAPLGMKAITRTSFGWCEGIRGQTSGAPRPQRTVGSSLCLQKLLGSYPPRGLMLGWGGPVYVLTGQPTLHVWKTLSPLFNPWVAGFVSGDLSLWLQVTLTTADCHRGGQLAKLGYSGECSAQAAL